MRSLFIILTFLVVLFLTGCGNEQSTASAEKEVNPQAAENEFITAATDYASANEKAVDQLDFLLSDLERVEDPTWQSDVESVLMDIYMTDTSYTLVETSLSEVEMEKYNSTVEHFYESSKLLDSVLENVTAAAEVYDKSKLKEVQKMLSKLKNELVKMKEQLETERYE